jgi:hypothetical protein
MTKPIQITRVRYPLRAIATVAAAGLLFLFNMTVGFLFMALVPPLIAVYVCVLFGSGSVLQSALAYAQRVSIVVPAAMLQHERHDEKVAQRAHAARAA